MNTTVEGQDESAVEVFDILSLSKRDINLLYTAFWDIDADNSGLVRPEELFAYFHVEGTPFERGIFSLFDEDNSGFINFMEFVCTMWNILTLPELNFGSVAYLLRDPSAKGNITYSDVKYILECMHNKKIDKDPNLHAIFNKMKKELSTKLSIHQFNKWTAANPSVTAPLVMLQLHLRLQVIGEPFWRKLSEARLADKDLGQLDYIKQLQHQVVSKNKAFTEKLASDERERRRMSRIGKGRYGDSRNLMERKQSVLLGYFSLKQNSFKARSKPDTRNKIIPLNIIAEDEEFHNMDAMVLEEEQHQHKDNAGGGAKGGGGGGGDDGGGKMDHHMVAHVPDKVRRRRSILKKPNLAPDNVPKATKSKKKSKATEEIET